ncbi:MAG: DNA-binding transcriptional regulator Fis [Steroidobacteraceae bacterium]
MASKKKTSSRKSTRNLAKKTVSKVNHASGASMPLRAQTAAALDTYLSQLNGDKPGFLYELVMREVEEPLFRAVLDYVDGNQSRAAEVLGINRGTLRKKLRQYNLTEAT